jgi:sugar phosphate isomerase/epimerase
MKLSLSTRVAEAPRAGRDAKTDLPDRERLRAQMALPELAQIARDLGYRALCMRASQLGVESSPEELRSARRLLDGLGLRVSMVAANADIPDNNDRAIMALREIGRHLDVAEALGADLIRICMKAHTDIPWARRAADEAAERGIRLAHQCHARTLFETVDMSLQVIREVGRENFGIIYEPAALLVCSQDYGRETIRAFAPHMFNVYLQNRWVHPQGREHMGTWINGPISFDLVPFGDPRGTDFAAVLRDLAEVGYDGYVTVHHVDTGTDVAGEARGFANYLTSVARFD